MKKLFKEMRFAFLAILVLGMFAAPALAATSLPDSITTRSLNIYKYSPIGTPGAGNGTTDAGAATDRVPLQDVEFEIYKLQPGEGVTLGTAPSDNGVTVENHTLTIPANLNATLETTVKTDSNGFASYSFGTTKDGIYLVAEKSNTAVATPAAPFYVSIPMTDPEGDGWLYTVTVYPKNEVPAGPSVNKDVTAIDQKHDSTDIGAAHTWIIRGSVPDDLYRTVGADAVYAKEYKFTDVLDSRLDYKGNVQVKLYKKDGTEISLTATTHYTLTEPATTGGGTLVVSLTNAGMKYVAENVGTGANAPEVRVYFDTAINDTAAVAVNIPNNVTLDYTNSANNKYTPVTVPEDKQPEVHMGGLHILKHKSGSETTLLAGATFKLAREATTAEQNDTTVTKDRITVGGEVKTVVYVSFYKDKNITPPAVSEVTTANDGTAVLYGLAYGNYYLVETKAPSGYNLLSAPMTVTVSATSHQNAGVIKVVNSAKFVLPATGGNGTFLFTTAGIVLIGLALILLAVSGKKKHGKK